MTAGIPAGQGVVGLTQKRKKIDAGSAGASSVNLLLESRVMALGYRLESVQNRTRRYGTEAPSTEKHQQRYKFNAAKVQGQCIDSIGARISQHYFVLR
jgi:hypothetical protein